MSFLDKLMFWKTNDPSEKFKMDFETGGNADLNWGPNSSQQQNLGQQQNPDFVFDPHLPKNTGNMDIGMENESARFGLGTNNQPSQQSAAYQYSQQQHKFSNDFSGEPAQQQSSQNYEYIISKELEVLSSKIEALKAVLDSVNQRLSNIERIAYAEQQR